MQVEEIIASASRNKTPVLALSWPQTKLKINAGGIQMDKNSLAHTSWNCKYHIVFALKYRRRVIFGNLKVEIGQILRDLCNRKGITIHEAEACPDHIHMLVSIPPKYSVSEVMGYLKGKSSLIIFERHANLKYKFGSRHFWCRGYFVDTVGKNAKKIEEYIKVNYKRTWWLTRSV